LAASSSRTRRKASQEPFIEVKLTESASICPARLEIVWAQPPVVKVYAGCDEKLLAHTLRCLREPTC
jgi:hypothetical protein